MLHPYQPMEYSHDDDMAGLRRGVRVSPSGTLRAGADTGDDAPGGRIDGASVFGQ